jgi:alpha-glucosidase
MLALPGSAYIFQGEELGLPEAVDLPDAARQDPTWFRTAGERYGRDGCRVPVPWTSTEPAYGFSPTGESWLPQPASWADLARDVQESDPASTLALYRTLLAARRARALGAGTLEWVDGYPADVLAFRNGNVTVVANIGDASIPLPHGNVIAASEPIDGGILPADTAVWVEAEQA